MRQTSLVLTIGLFATLACGNAHACSAQGAFGIPFGTKLPLSARRLEDRPDWYALEPPRRDGRFDSYQVLIDPGSGEILAVAGVHIIGPAPDAARARHFAFQYLRSLPAWEQRALHRAADGAPIWSGVVGDGVGLKLQAGSPREVRVECTDIHREWAAASRGATPEGSAAPAAVAPPPGLRLPTPPASAATAQPQAHTAAQLQAQVRAAVSANMSYPREAVLQLHQGVALVRLRLYRDGRIATVSLLQTSGFAELDREAIDIFQRIGHFEAVAPDFDPQALETQFDIPIRFELNPTTVEPSVPGVGGAGPPPAASAPATD